MPRIQEYLPQENSAGPQGAVSPNLEQVSATGRSIADIGKISTEIGDRLYERQAQMETSDAASAVAQQREQLTEQMTQSVQDGTFDVSKFKENFQNWQNDASQQYETPAAQNAFNRQSNRLLGTMLIKGMNAQATVASNNAINSFNESVNANSATLQNDPSQFQDIYHSMLEDLDTRQTTGGLKAKDAPALAAHAAEQYAQSAIMGVAQSDPEAALKMIRSTDTSENGLARFLKPETQDRLENRIETLQRIQEGADARQMAIQEKASKAAAEKFMVDNRDKIANGQIDPKSFILSPPPGVDFKTALSMARDASAAQAFVQKTNPAKMNNIVERANLPPDDPRAITSSSDIYNADDIAPKDKSKLIKWYMATPRGQAERSEELAMVREMQSKLKVPGMPDQDAASRIAIANEQYQNAKAKVLQEGGDVRSLTDPNSKDYFPKTLRPISAQDLMQANVAKMTGAAQGGSAFVYTTPGVRPQDAEKVGEKRVSLQDGRTAVYTDEKQPKFLRFEGKKK